MDGTQAARNLNVNAIFMLNGTEEDVNSFRWLFQENLIAFHKKPQLWKSKLQSFPYPSRVGHVMYCANNIQLNDLIGVKCIKDRNSDSLRGRISNRLREKLFYRNHNRSDETERIFLNNWKAPTIYCPPKFPNILAIHLLSALSYDTDSNHLMSGFQKRFVPSPGACLTYQPHHAFYAYLVDLGRMSLILDTVPPKDSVFPDHFHHPILMDPESPLFISTYNIIPKIPRSHLDPLPEFLQCNKHSKHGSIYSLSLHERSLNCKKICCKAPHDLNAI